VSTPTIPLQAIEGRESLDRAAQMQRRFYAAWQRQGQSLSRRRIVLTPTDWVLMTCLALCLIVIGMGLDRLYPKARPTVSHAIYADLPIRPFPDCADAHAAGIYDIPAGSPAYSIDQDPNRNGLACER